MGPVEPDVVNMPKIGSLYRLDLDGSLHTMVKDVGISNGLAWTADEKFMFYIDSTPRQIYRYDFEKSTGNICMYLKIDTIIVNNNYHRYCKTCCIFFISVNSQQESDCRQCGEANK